MCFNFGLVSVVAGTAFVLPRIAAFTTHGLLFGFFKGVPFLSCAILSTEWQASLEKKSGPGLLSHLKASRFFNVSKTRRSRKSPPSGVFRQDRRVDENPSDSSTFMAWDMAIEPVQPQCSSTTWAAGRINRFQRRSPSFVFGRQETSFVVCNQCHDLLRILVRERRSRRANHRVIRQAHVKVAVEGVRKCGSPVSSSRRI